MSSNTPASSIVSERYALALLDLAEQGKAVEKVLKDFETLEGAIQDSEDFARFLTSPGISESQQKSVLDEIAKKAKLQKLTTNFLGVIVENGRLNALAGIILTFKKKVSEKKGEISIAVETAFEMTAKQKQDLQKKIEKALGTGVSMDVGVNPDIIGGIVVTIGSYMIDDSVRRKLERLNATLVKGASQNDNGQKLREVV